MPNFKHFQRETRRIAKSAQKKIFPAIDKEVSALKRRFGKLEHRMAKLEMSLLKSRKTSDKALIKPKIIDPRLVRTSPQLIYNLRERLMLSQKQLGLLIGVSRTIICRWESDESAPNEKFKALIAEIRKLKPAQARKLLGYYRPEQISLDRERLRLSKASFARLLGVCRAAVTNWEKGKTSPRKENKAKINMLISLNSRQLKKLLARHYIIQEG